MGEHDLTLVVDIGKSHAKLLWIDDTGRVLQRQTHANHSVKSRVESPLGYDALDIVGLTQWLAQGIAGSVHTGQCQRIVVTTHGAAFVAMADLDAPVSDLADAAAHDLQGTGLALAPLDYEFAALDAEPELAQAYTALRDDFASSLAPDLPGGLNAARQFFWLQQHFPSQWAQVRCLMPYPQYWAWWLSGVASTELSSLGCHTQLWSVRDQGYSTLAKQQGWSALFAPMRSAWEVLGCVRPQWAQQLGLASHCEVLVGVHDSNACLARYLSGTPPAPAQASETQESLTLVSSGTWTVIMAPGADIATLDAQKDMLGNVSVLGQATPTARFMGGREFAVILDGAPADEVSEHDVQYLIQNPIFALPAFAAQGGPFRARRGKVLCGKQPCSVQSLSRSNRAALAALYCAQVTAWLIARLRPQAGASGQPSRIVVEGPLATNLLYMQCLQTLLPTHACMTSSDTLEGTARGAWLLAHWGRHAENVPTQNSAYLKRVTNPAVPGLAAYHARWLKWVDNDW